MFLWVFPWQFAKEPGVGMEKKKAFTESNFRWSLQKPSVCASSTIFIRVMHSSKPAQGEVVDSCQFRGVWRCLVQLGSSTVKVCRAGAASPFPWTLSPFSQPARQQTSWKVPFDHGDGAPFPASKLLSRFEGVCPWTGKSSLSEKSIKANSCVSGSARQPCNRHTHAHTLWHQEVFGAVQLYAST